MNNFFLKTYKGINLMTYALLSLVAICVVAFPHSHSILAAAPLLGFGMIFDSRNQFCKATALNTGGVAKYVIGSLIDLGVGFNNTLIDRALGNGENLYLNISVDTACLSATGSVKFHLVSDAQDPPNTNGTETYHYTSGAFLQAGLTAGTTLFCVPLPGGVKYERYLGILQETITAAFTAGKVNAFLSLDPRV
jgi:hypothetical protein